MKRPSTVDHVASDGSVSDGGSGGLTDYTIITADSLADANTRAKGCPVLQAGGTIDVYEAMPMG